jgi:hypothetical protein
MEYFNNIAIGWNIICKILVYIYGYLPAKKFSIGSDDETKSSLYDCCEWLKLKNLNLWIDSGNDNYDYLYHWNQIYQRPHVWHISGRNDKVLGHSIDVKNWAKLTEQTQKYSELSIDNGYTEDYDHIGLLTSKNAIHDHFPDIYTWIQDHNQ